MRDLKNLVSMVVVKYRLFNTFSSKAVKANYFIYNYALLSTCFLLLMNCCKVWIISPFTSLKSMFPYVKICCEDTLVNIFYLLFLL